MPRGGIIGAIRTCACGTDDFHKPVFVGRRTNFHHDCRRGIAPVSQTVWTAGECRWINAPVGRKAEGAITRGAVIKVPSLTGSPTLPLTSPGPTPPRGIVPRRGAPAGWGAKRSSRDRGGSDPKPRGQSWSTHCPHYPHQLRDQRCWPQQNRRMLATSSMHRRRRLGCRPSPQHLWGGCFDRPLSCLVHRPLVPGSQHWQGRLALAQEQLCEEQGAAGPLSSEVCQTCASQEELLTRTSSGCHQAFS